MIGRLFGSNDSNDSCTAHHWGDYKPNWDSISTRVGKTEMMVGKRGSDDTVSFETVEMEVPREARCVHDGCNSYDRKFRRTFTIPMRVRYREDGESVFVDLTAETHNKIGPEEYAESLRDLADALENAV